MKEIKEIKRIIESTNINFLFGAGLSYPFLAILNTIETDLTKAVEDEDESEMLKLKKQYFEKSILGNLKIIDDESDKDKDDVLKNYINFYKILNHILLVRDNTVLSKQVNIFTTNIDIFSEKALEESKIDFNDGFQGRFNPEYNIGNFKKSFYKKSLHYENKSEIPVFNILKLHGSVSWEQKDEKILLDNNLKKIRNMEGKDGDEFTNKYENLVLVNPTKKKFEDTVRNQQYYDLLRVFSNELERENSVLFVMGFSFEDEHIRKQVSMIADSNPTLKIYVFSHGSTVKKDGQYETLKKGAKNKNIDILYPECKEKYNLEAITKKIFNKIIEIYNVEKDNNKEEDE